MKNIFRIPEIILLFLVLLLIHSCKRNDDNSIRDVDGNVYSSVAIGTQVWLIENLKTSKYRNGDLIGTTTPATLDITSETTPKYQWAYNGNETNVAIYGRLYTWYAVTDSRKLCPAGWHIPTSTEWDILVDFLGDWYYVSGSKMKESGTSHWVSPNEGATNESGFTGLPGGQRSYSMNFEDLGRYGYWWSTTEGDNIHALGRMLSYASNSALIPEYLKYAGFSLRCLKDN